ncbi:DUF2080 family transposase-associated protein [Archaeoglobus neptunius]|uniref:DUF2080 family transposase-associated protein n=1 Tax=Archaeoglobus neptunius TaxID=2798580 RepID=UPI001925A807|nr:DUF2080 family transposase-associated protein [Archaeoglobus neptunius]
MRLENSELSLKPSPDLLSILAENYEKLAAAGVEIKLSLRSDKFKAVKRDEEGKEYLEIDPDPALIDAFENLAPAFMLTFSMEVEDNVTKYSDARVYTIECKPVRARCPFCGHEQEYYACYIPHAYPYRCTNCNASVSSEIGDEGDVTESLHFRFDTADIHRVGEKTLRARDENGMDVVATLVQRDEGTEDFGLWLIFHQSKSVDVTPADVTKLVTDKELTKAGVKLRFNGVEGKDYVVKTPKKAGTSAGIYVPARWIGREVLALLTHR